MTTVYFVRHAEPNYENHDDRTRELSPKGMEDRRLVTKFLSDKKVDVVLSSPYRRAVDTVSEFAESQGLAIRIVEDFRERRIDSEWIADFLSFSRAQWADFDYRLLDGECLREVQERNIRALNSVLEEYQGKTVAVGSHGTALSTIVNYYDRRFGYQEFDKIRALMPWIVRFTFDGKNCVDMKQYDLFGEKGNDM
ncbi:MAG: histidine phosphatase family protein [Lachnospiraceae bacterium]